MGALKKLWREAVHLHVLAATPFFVNMFEVALTVSAVIMLGQFGNGSFAAGIIGLVYYNFAWYIIQGVLSAQDILARHYLQLGNIQACRYWSYIAVFVAITLCGLASLLFLLCTWVVEHIFKVEWHLSHKAGTFVWAMLPGLWCHSIYLVIQKYLHARNKWTPSVVCSASGLVIYLLVIYLLIFQSEVGFLAFGWSVSVVRGAMLCIMWFFFLREQEDYSILRRELRVLVKSNFGLIYTCCEGIVGYATYIVTSSRVIVTGSSLSTGNGPGMRGGVEMTPVPTEEDDDEKKDSKIQGVGKRHRGRASEQDHDFLYEGHVDAEQRLNLLDEEDDDDYREEEQEEEQEEGVYIEDTDHNDFNRPERALSNKKRGAGRRSTSRRLSNLFLNIIRFALLGFPNAIILVVDLWGLELLALFVVATLGKWAVDAFMVMILTTTFTHSLGLLQLCNTATRRISSLLQKKKHEAARAVAWILILECSCFSLAFALFIYFGSFYLASLYSSDLDVIKRVVSIAPYGAGFQLCFGLHTSTQSVLRALGMQKQLIWHTLISVWMVGIPTAAYLVLIARPMFGLEGVWAGLLTGYILMTIVHVGLVLFVSWKAEVGKSILRHRLTVQRGSSRSSATSRADTAEQGLLSGGAGGMNEHETRNPLIRELLLEDIRTREQATRIEGKGNSPGRDAVQFDEENRDGGEENNTDDNNREMSNVSTGFTLTHAEIELPALGGLLTLGGFPWTTHKSAEDELNELEFEEYVSNTLN